MKETKFFIQITPFNSNCHNGHISTELQKGIKVESEHKKTIDFLKAYVRQHKKFPENKKIYKSIARDHLMEDDDYYEKLARLEKH